ncbi:MAG TPA: LptF/LptG family permease [Longimicrobiaceae bacterium]|nr:LptF/LptG family permease [Longimicrobiaceae bacterium]
MKLLDRYLLRQFTGTFLGLVLGLPLLFIVADVTDNLDKYIDKGIPGRAVASSYVYALPQFIYWALPIAALVATVFAIGNMTRHQEITAAKAGGVSFFRLIAPLVLAAGLISVVGVGVGDLIPVTNARREAALGQRSLDASDFRNSFVFQSQDGRTLAVHRLDASQKVMVQLAVQRPAAAHRPEVSVIAYRATWDRPRGWTLKNGYLRLIPPGRATTDRAFRFDSLRIPSIKETPRELLAQPKDAAEMRYSEMGEFIRTVQRSGGDTRKLRVERAQRITLPLAVLVIVLFGAPLSTSSKRGGAAYGVGISLAVTMVYLMLFKIGTAVGSSGSLDPLVAAWMPNVLFLVGGVYLMARVRT